MKGTSQVYVQVQISSLDSYRYEGKFEYSVYNLYMDGIYRSRTQPQHFHYQHFSEASRATFKPHVPSRCRLSLKPAPSSPSVR